MGIFTSRAEKLEKSKSFLNKAIIGLGYGLIKTKDLILNDVTEVICGEIGLAIVIVGSPASIVKFLVSEVLTFKTSSQQVTFQR